MNIENNCLNYKDAWWKFRRYLLNWLHSRTDTKFCRQGFKFPDVCRNTLKAVRRRLNQFIIQVLGDTSTSALFAHMYVNLQFVASSKSHMENSKPLLYSYSLSLRDNSGPKDRFLHNFTSAFFIESFADSFRSVRKFYWSWEKRIGWHLHLV